MKLLYITYDGLTDFLGQSQVLPYLVGCARAGHRITVISFEKPDRLDRIGAQVADICAHEGLDWRPQRFRASPPYIAKWLDLRAMERAAAEAMASQEFEAIHCRSYPPAVVGLRLKRRTGVPLLFDMRGFWPDSRRDGGRWPASSPVGGFLFRRWKGHEAELIANADHIVCLAVAAREAIEAWPAYEGAPISVIPCCADFQLFRPSRTAERAAARQRLGLAEDAPTLLYVGSLGTIYLLSEQLRLFDGVRRRDPRSKLLFVGRNDPEAIMAEAARLNIRLSTADFRTVAAERAEMAYWISAGDVGMCFYVPTFSSLGVSPTKLAEYLACGVPAIANRGVGDVERILTQIDGGHVLPDLGDASIEAAADAFFRLRGTDGQALRERARPLLDLSHAVDAYARLYADPAKAVTVGG